MEHITKMIDIGKNLLIIAHMTFDSKKQKIWFISDLHYGHNKPFILTPRNYNRVEDAMQHTWRTLREAIGENDIVFNLGDLVIGAGLNTIDYAWKLISLPCAAHYFINGNHSAGVKDIYKLTKMDAYPTMPDDAEVYPLTVVGTPFIFLGHRVEISIDGQCVVLDHYPIASWNHIAKGAYHIHGHCHRNLKEDLSLKRLDVGWEWQRRPVEWNEIVRELSPRKAFAPDHHGDAID